MNDDRKPSSNASPINRGKGFCVHRVSLNEHCEHCEREHELSATTDPSPKGDGNA